MLVERCAVANWRLRRSVRAESALYSKLAEDAARAFDAECHEGVERNLARFDDDPGAALGLLESDAMGIDRLLRSWTELDAALESGPSGWDQRYHTRLMLLLGHRRGTTVMEAGELATASARLLTAGKPGAAALPEGQAEETVTALRRRAAQAIGRLRALRGEVPDRSWDRRRAMDAAAADTTAEARLRHRYEMEHEKSLKWALRELKALAKSGLDLPDEPEPGPPAVPEAAPATAAPAPAAPGWSGENDSSNET